MSYHRWISADEGYVSCLNCGGLWEETVPGSITTDTIRSATGDYPTPCTSTSSVHGYAGERYCHECDVSDTGRAVMRLWRDVCEHIRETDECNCLLCYS